MSMELPRHSSHNSLSAWKRSPYRSKNKREQVTGSAAQRIGALLGLYSGIFLLVPLAGSFPTFFTLKRIVPAEKSDWFPAISVQAGPAMWVLGVAVIFEQYMIVWTVSFSFLVLSGCITGLGTLR